MEPIRNVWESESSRGRWTAAARIIDRLGSRRLPVAAAGLAVLLTAPSLGVGWVIDDNVQRLRFFGSDKLPEIPADPWKFFTFSDGDPEQTLRLMDRGIWPWWTYKNIHAAFWRPLTVLTHWLDYSLWPDHPALMHAQSVIWYAAVAWVVALLYRRFLGATWVAGLAAVLYAVDDGRGMPVGFLANRNALVATFFGMAAVLAHDRWRRSGWKPGAVIGPGLFGAGLLGAEAGVGALAYIVAHAVFLDKAAGRRRILVPLPYIIVLVFWRMAWHWAGGGIEGIGLYVDPLTEPGRFLREAVFRVPILLLGQWALPPSDSYLLTAELGWLPPHAAITFVLLAFIAGAVWPVIRQDSVSRFFGLGMILALGPICATFPSDRMLFFVGLGAFGLIARFLAQSRESVRFSQTTQRPKLTRLVRFVLIAVHAGLAPLGLAVRSAMPVGPPQIMKGFLIPPVTDPALKGQTVVLVTAPVILAATYFPIMQALAGLPVPAHVRFLAPHQPPVDIRRVDDRTLVIRPAGGFLKSPWDQLARNGCHPMSLGERVELAGMTAEVTALTSDRRPAEVKFRFDRPLEDPSFRWLYWSPQGFETKAPPNAE
jgi:hypothetical protein